MSKRRTPFHKSLLGGLLALTLGWGMPALAQVDYTIEGEVDRQAGTIKLSSNAPCPSNDPGAGKGCVDANDFTLLRIRLTNEPEFQFTRMLICRGADKPDSARCRLNRLERIQFAASRGQTDYVLIPKANGVIRLREMQPAGAVRSFLLYNANNTPQTYFYVLEACRNGGTEECVRSDPRIRNRGRGVNN